MRRISIVFMMLVCMALAILPEAQAAKHEIEDFKSNVVTQDNREWLRLEFIMDRSKIEHKEYVKKEKPKQLRVKVKNTNMWSPEGIVLDKDFARFMTVTKSGKKDIEIMVSFAKTVAEQDYRVYTLEPEKKKKNKKDKTKNSRSVKKPTLVIEIARDKAGSEEIVDDEDYGTVNGVKGWRITIDPGHGGSDTGARHPSGYTEKVATLAISKYVQGILKNSGARVSMTREDDRDVYGVDATDAQELQARVDVGEQNKADLFVCIHCNASGGNRRASGTETYSYPGSTRSARLAELIDCEIQSATGLNDRGARTANFYVLHHSSMPAVLVETAFVDNDHDVKLLSTPKHQKVFAMAICRGISRYAKEFSKK